MSPTVYFIALFVVCYLFAVNMHLRGRKTQMIEMVLGWVVLAWVTAGFFLLNWKWGILAIVACFVFVALCQPVAIAIAGKLVGRR